MHEQLRAEILDDADAGGNRSVADDHCLRPKADRCPLATEFVAHPDLSSADLERPSRGDRQHVHRRRTDKARDEEIRRLVVKLGRRVTLLQESVAQDGDAVAHRHRLHLVVGDIDSRYGETLLKLDELCPGLHAELCVQVRERLVHQIDLRMTHDRAAHGDTLALAAGEVARLAVEIGLEVEQLRRFAHPLCALVFRNTLLLQGEAHVGGDVEVRVERVILEDHGDVTVTWTNRRDVLASDQDPPTIERLEAGEHA